MQNSEQLDRAFNAMADTTRRAILTRLGTAQQLSVSDLARPFDMSLPAVMKHIAVLESAGLGDPAKVGPNGALQTQPQPNA